MGQVAADILKLAGHGAWSFEKKTRTVRPETLAGFTQKPRRRQVGGGRIRTPWDAAFF